MADFFQNGVITTLHKLRERDVEDLENEILKYSRYRPVTLILPALFSEFQGKALPRILKELEKVPYISKIVVSLDKANFEEFKKAKGFFSRLPCEVKIIWNDGERIQRLYQLLKSQELLPETKGKGRGVWISLGYVLAEEGSYAVATHDCDIVNYKRELLARLIYPVVNPNLDYEFCKGYYARVDEKLYGRVSRLFFTPLLRALIKIIGPIPFFLYLDSFRYALAGEFSMTVDLARIVRIPADWGLEIGLLSEIYLNLTLKRICQTEIIDYYEHKHQPISKDSPEAGLMRMAVDIAKTLFRIVAQDGVIFTDGFFRTLGVTYLREAWDKIEKYAAVAAINGLDFDRHEEATAVEAFVRALDIAASEFMEHPVGVPLIPNWNRVTSAIPEFFELLLDAVHEDNEMR